MALGRGARRADPGDLGHLARTLRECTAGVALTVPVLDPIEAALGAVAHLPDDDPEAAFVRIHAVPLAGAWAGTPHPRTPSVGLWSTATCTPATWWRHPPGRASPTWSWPGPALELRRCSGGGGPGCATAPTTPTSTPSSPRLAPIPGLDRVRHVLPPSTSCGSRLWAVGVRHSGPSWARGRPPVATRCATGAEEPWTLR
ncbi:MAG: hypothetical protein R2746_04510 [Acidimicrobiales bacterium]